MSNYKEMLFELLPKGIAFNREYKERLKINGETTIINGQSSGTMRLLDAFAQELQRVEDKIIELALESNPVTMNDAISARFLEASLPDPCIGTPTNTAEKRSHVVGKWAAQGGVTVKYLKDVLNSYGYPVKIVPYFDVSPPFVIQSTAIQSTGIQESFAQAFTVYWVDQSVVYFRAGSNNSEDYLNVLQNNAVPCLIERYKPAQTQAIYSPVNQATYDAITG